MIVRNELSNSKYTITLKNGRRLVYIHSIELIEYSIKRLFKIGFLSFFKNRGRLK